MRMEVVKKVCTAMLVFCLSLVVMVGTADAAERCAMEPSHIWFKDAENVTTNVVSVDDKPVQSLYLRFNSYEKGDHQVKFKIRADKPDERLEKVTVSGGKYEPQKTYDLFKHNTPFKEVQVISDSGSVDMYIDGNCAE
jgi:hypothetical protein